LFAKLAASQGLPSAETRDSLAKVNQLACDGVLPGQRPCFRWMEFVEIVFHK